MIMTSLGGLRSDGGSVTRLLQNRNHRLSLPPPPAPASRTQHCGSSAHRLRRPCASQSLASNGRWHLSLDGPSLPRPQTPNDPPEPGSLASAVGETIPASGPRALGPPSRLSSQPTSVVSMQMPWPLIMPVRCCAVVLLCITVTLNPHSPAARHLPELGKSRMPPPPLKYAAG